MNSPKVLLIKDDSADDFLQQTLLEERYAIIDQISTSAAINRAICSHCPDIVVLNVGHPTRAILDHLREAMQKHACPIVLFADDNDTETINAVIKSGVSAYVVDGLRSGRIRTIIEIAIARFNEQQQLQDELKKAKHKLEERKLVDRAKGILIKTQGFNEDEAYHKLRKLAMDRNIPIGEMARNVISMEEFFN